MADRASSSTASHKPPRTPRSSTSSKKKKKKKRKVFKCKLVKKAGHLLPSLANMDSTGQCAVCAAWKEQYDKAAQFEIQLPTLRQEISGHLAKINELEKKKMELESKDADRTRLVKTMDEHNKKLLNKNQEEHEEKNKLLAKSALDHKVIEEQKAAIQRALDGQAAAEQARAECQAFTIEATNEAKELSIINTKLVEEKGALEAEKSKMMFKAEEQKAFIERLQNELREQQELVRMLDLNKTICTRCVIGAVTCVTCRRVCDEVADTTDNPASGKLALLMRSMAPSPPPRPRSSTDIRPSSARSVRPVSGRRDGENVTTKGRPLSAGPSVHSLQQHGARAPSQPPVLRTPMLPSIQINTNESPETSKARVIQATEQGRFILQQLERERAAERKQAER